MRDEVSIHEISVEAVERPLRKVRSFFFY